MAPDVTDVQPLSGDVEVGTGAGVSVDDGVRHRKGGGSGGGGPSVSSGHGKHGLRTSPGRRELDLGPGIAPKPFGAYLGMVDFCRVVVCVSVVFQHSFLWTGMS